ncbi:hypothetical protein EB118_00240 [bacterium]|nr:hypothetical protein [bacterium]
MFSDYFYTSIEIGKRFQKTNTSWGGDDCKNYHNQIRVLMDKYQAKTLLDFGCGKGRQYVNLVPYGLPYDKTTEPMTFQTRINAQEVYKYDPCVEEFSTEPCGQIFDAVICTQVLGSIPDIDMKNFANKLAGYAREFVFIGLHNPFKPIKRKKMMYDSKYISYPRSVDWYIKQFEHITRPEIYWWFRDYETEYNHWYYSLI